MFRYTGNSDKAPFSYAFTELGRETICSVTAQVSEEYSQQILLNSFRIPKWTIRIAWTLLPTKKSADETQWETIDHLSMLNDGWIPSDGIEFFGRFICSLRENWTNLCHRGEEHFDQCVSY